jgi:hypothetical protein
MRKGLLAYTLLQQPQAAVSFRLPSSLCSLPVHPYQGYLRAGKCYVKLGDFVRAKMQYEKGTYL